jgi:predicted alpha/beta superfamily hydrolase
VILFVTTLLFTACTLFAQITGGPAESIGTRYSIESSVLGEIRHFSLHLPRGYESSTNRYPLLIVLDGEDFFHFITGTVDYYAAIGRIPDLVVIGIHSADRWRDYTPTRADIPDGTPLPTSGGAEKFHRFISEELMAFVQSNFRVTPFHGLYGHSIAGLFVLNTMLDHPEAFDAYLATSPSLWWDGELLTQKTANNAGRFPVKQYLFMTMGNEGETMYDPMVDFAGALEGAAPENLFWEFKHFKDVDHQTMPFKAFTFGLEFLFSDWMLPAGAMERGLGEVISHYDKLSDKYQEPIEIPEGVLNRLGYMELNRGNTDGAIEVFRLNVKKYPGSANVYDSLAEGYLKKGDRRSAVANYRKSLELNPMNENAREMLEQLEK